MLPDYERVVMEDYHSKKTAGTLPSNLSEPTQAKIKKQCLRLLGNRLQNKDEKILKDFCEEWDDSKSCYQNVDNYDVDKFKPLSNFLKGVTESTDYKNIELLAWLIDFRERPFQSSRWYAFNADVDSEVKTVSVDENYKSEPSDELKGKMPDTAGGIFRLGVQQKAVDETIAVTPSTDSTPERPDSLVSILPAWRYWSASVAGFLLLLAGIAGFQTWDKKVQAMLSPGNGGCMYWAGDHYQPINCNQKVSNTQVVALDTVLVKKFRKITQPDTITYNAKGTVWYSKINNNVEFFTADGVHPIVTDRHLKPITNYMIDKYIRSGISANQ